MGFSIRTPHIPRPFYANANPGADYTDIPTPFVALHISLPDQHQPVPKS